MFTVYHSNQLDLLTTIAAALISGRPLRDPFQPEVILVQSTGVAQWMQIELAAHLGIVAHIHFPLPTSFIWQMFTRILPDIPDENAFAKSTMTWRIMALLPSLCQQAEFASISEYLLRTDDDKRKQFQFAARMADLFDQYLVYRPDWLVSWQRSKSIASVGDSQRWQAPLWRALLAETERAGKPLLHHANLYTRFIQTLAHSKIRPPGLPDRVFICGISALPPTYLRVFQALGRHIDIHLLFTNPCRYYWGDIYDRNVYTHVRHRRRKKHRQHDQQQTEQELFQNPAQTTSYTMLDKLEEQQIGNPLLASWGKQGRDNLYLLTQMDCIAEVDAFVEPVGDNLLSLIQRDILVLEDHAVIGMENETFQQVGSQKRPLRTDDRSLSLHVCYSPQREVEVLHDSVLAMIAEDQTLRLRDIIVMVADIDRYTPAIQAVFGNADGKKKHLPFAIADRRARYLHPILPAFLSLLELPHSRFAADQVLALLEIPALAARFAINEQGLQLLRQWMVESRMRWGLLNDDMLRELMLPATSQHTWQFGLTRILLGVGGSAMDSESGDWKGIMPYDNNNISSGLIASLAGQLAKLLMRLRQWRDRLAQPRSLNAWLSYARDMIEDFFAPDADVAAAVSLLENQWQQMLLCGLKVGYDQPVPVTLLRDALSARLDKEENISHNFLAASTINFCTLMPMRSLPFRVVCLLGMNDGVYPRTLPPAGFDLMAQQPWRGDRNMRDDDRYLFLQALLSAQQRLYISFIGRAIQDNTLRYPSVLVSELSDYIAHSFHLPGDELADAESSAHRVRTHLWQWHSRMPFAPENFIPGSEIQSFADEWLPAARTEGEPQPDFATAPLTERPCKVLTLDKLLRFYRHPVRAWFMQRLSVSFHHTSIKLTTDEPFVIDSLTRYKLNNRLVNTLIKGEKTELLFRQVQAAGLLPYGAFGELYWDRQCQEMSALSERVRKWQLPEKHNMEVYLMLDNVTLIGWLPRVQATGQLRWRPGTLSARDGLLLWLEHLAYCAMGGEGESRMLGTSNEWLFAPLPVSQAKVFLLSFIVGYCKGMASPLLLLPLSGGAWLKNCYNPITQSIDRDESQQRQARDKLIQVWQGNGHVPGESRDPYLQRLIRNLNEQHIEKIMSVAERYLLSPLMFNLA